MKVIPLWKIVAENGVEIFREHGKIGVKVDSDLYQGVKDWFIKGEYQIVKETLEHDDSGKIYTILKYARLEKDITITINRPTVNGEKLPEEKELLQEMADEVFTIAVFHRRTLDFVGKEIKRAHIPAFVEAVRDSHYKRTGEKGDSKDFGVVRIDWENKKVFIESV